MFDNIEEEQIVRQGNEWEVIVLTESMYAASPGPEQNILHNSQTLIGEDNAETARAVFMSGHFGYSPITHENFPLESKYEETCFRKDSHHGKRGFKHEEKLNIKGLISDEYVRVPQYDEKCDSLSFYGSEPGDIASSDLTEKEKNVYSTGTFGSYDDEVMAGMSYKADEATEIDEPFESLAHAVSSGASNFEEDKFNQLPNLPCEAWWRRRADSLYCHAKNANPVWSTLVAAAVVGIVIIGHWWQRDKPQVLQIKSQSVINDEGSRWIRGPMAGLKKSLRGQYISYIRVSCPTDR